MFKNESIQFLYQILLGQTDTTARTVFTTSLPLFEALVYSAFSDPSVIAWRTSTYLNNSNSVPKAAAAARVQG
jgi:hypothetical protein